MNGCSSQFSDEKSTKSKRIASNTIVLFIRMFAIMVINLYAVRIVLRALGEVDYGVFNTIAGVVLTSSFLITTLAISIQRFYSYSLGKQDTARLAKIFTASMNIILILIVVLIIVLETFGLWFVNTQLTIPIEKVNTVHWLFHFAVLSLFFSFVQIPYTAAIFAREHMGAFALISLFECLGRLLVALLIGKVMVSDGLFFYGAGLLTIAVLVFMAYVLYTRCNFAECHYKRGIEKNLYKELISFSGWTTYSAISGMSIVHGNTILLNIYFGPVAVAAYAIANQIHNAITALGNSIVIAFRPAMVKAYAEKNFTYLDTLFYAGSKSILYLLLCVSIPLVIEMPAILNLWLEETSSQMILFSRFFVVFMILLMMQCPITTIIQSTGEIKHYSLYVDSITLLSLPISWLLYSLGAPDYSCFLSMITLFIIAHIVRLVCLSYRYEKFSYTEYGKTILLPGLIVSTSSLAVAFFVHRQSDSTIMDFLSVSAVSVTVTPLLAYAIGLSRQERLMLQTFVTNYFRHK